MRKMLYGAMFAALFAQPQLANATDVLRIKLDVSGYATRWLETYNGQTVTNYRLEGALNSTLEFVVAGSSILDFAGRDTFGSYLFANISGNTNTSRFTAGMTSTPYTRGGTIQFGATACGDFTNISYGVTYAVNPLCSSVLFRQGIPDTYTSGDLRTYTGTITGITVTRATTTESSAAYVINAPVLPIPEVSTWAMMILGTGVAGFAMRRRRYTESFAAQTEAFL